MPKKPSRDDPHPDWELIEKLGGPPKIVELLNMQETGALQRVHNWKWRGIPSAVKLERPDLFLPELRPRLAKHEA
jgi:hypothetical protein